LLLIFAFLLLPEEIVSRNCNDNREVVGKVHVVVIFAKRGIPLTDFYKIWHGEVFQVCTLTPNFTVLAE